MRYHQSPAENMSYRSTSVARALPPITRSEVTRTYRSSSCAPVDRFSSTSYRTSRLERYHNSDPIRYAQYPRFQSRFYR